MKKNMICLMLLVALLAALLSGCAGSEGNTPTGALGNINHPEAPFMVQFKTFEQYLDFCYMVEEETDAKNAQPAEKLGTMTSKLYKSVKGELFHVVSIGKTAMKVDVRADERGQSSAEDLETFSFFTIGTLKEMFKSGMAKLTPGVDDGTDGDEQTDPTDPAEPTEPTEPTDPTDPTETGTAPSVAE